MPVIMFIDVESGQTIADLIQTIKNAYSGSFIDIILCILYVAMFFTIWYILNRDIKSGHNTQTGGFSTTNFQDSNHIAR